MNGHKHPVMVADRCAEYVLTFVRGSTGISASTDSNPGSKDVDETVRLALRAQLAMLHEFTPDDWMVVTE